MRFPPFFNHKFETGVLLTDLPIYSLDFIKSSPPWIPKESLTGGRKKHYCLPNWSSRKNIIKGKFSPSLTSADKKKAWEDISGVLNASHITCTRSPSDCEKKWYNILSKSRTEIAAFKKNILCTGRLYISFPFACLGPLPLALPYLLIAFIITNIQTQAEAPQANH